MYFTALISFAFAIPCSYVIVAMFFSLKLSIVSLSSLKSSLVPTSMIGVLGQCIIESLARRTDSVAIENYLRCETSGYHFAETFSNELGEIMEKHRRNTSV